MTQRVIPILILCAVSVTSVSQNTDYATVARQTVENEIRKSGQPIQEFQIEIDSGPTALPDHIRLHRPDVVPPDRARLTGRVVDDLWNPAGNMRISLTPVEKAGAPVFTITSGAGEFQISDIAPGWYEALLEKGPVSKRLKIPQGAHRILIPLGDFYGPHFLFSPGEPPPVRVSLSAYRNNQLVRIDFVEFEGPEAVIRHTDIDLTSKPANFDDEGLGKPIPMPADERKQLNADLAPLLTALFDVAQGPERMRPFLSSRIVCRVYYSGERRIPSVDDTRCALNLLDSTGLANWYRLEADTEDMGELLFDWYEPRKGVSDEQLMGIAQRQHEVLRNELRNAGMFAAEHSNLAQRYFRASVPAAIKANVDLPNPELPIPRGTVYVLVAPIPIYLVREGGQLRVVCVFLAGG